MEETLFKFDKRLGIPIPNLQYHWEDYETNMQQHILMKWESIRGMIPDRIKYLETMINEKQEKLNNEEDFEECCRLNEQIGEIASVINDLWILYRIDQQVTTA